MPNPKRHKSTEYLRCAVHQEPVSDPTGSFGMGVEHTRNNQEPCGYTSLADTEEEATDEQAGEGMASGVSAEDDTPD